MLLHVELHIIHEQFDEFPYTMLLPKGILQLTMYFDAFSYRYFLKFKDK